MYCTIWISWLRRSLICRPLYYTVSYRVDVSLKNKCGELQWILKAWKCKIRQYSKKTYSTSNKNNYIFVIQMGPKFWIPFQVIMTDLHFQTEVRLVTGHTNRKNTIRNLWSSCIRISLMHSKIISISWLLSTSMQIKWLSRIWVAGLTVTAAWKGR